VAGGGCVGCGGGSVGSGSVGSGSVGNTKDVLVAEGGWVCTGAAVGATGVELANEDVGPMAVGLAAIPEVVTCERTEVGGK
jgi:hypothetical protein